MNFHKNMGDNAYRTGQNRSVSKWMYISKRWNFNEGALVKWTCGWRFFRPLNLKHLLELIIFLSGSVNLFWHSEPKGGGETCLLKIIIMENQKRVLITELWEKISQQAAGFDLGMQRHRNVWESGITLPWLDWHPPTPVYVLEMHSVFLWKSIFWEPVFLECNVLNCSAGRGYAMRSKWKVYKIIHVTQQPRDKKYPCQLYEFSKLLMIDCDIDFNRQIKANVFSVRGEEWKWESVMIKNPIVWLGKRGIPLSVIGMADRNV